jgi:AcrR family transcriptional regulator
LHQAGRAGERRRAIFSALRACVIEKGYSKTGLADVARAAGMSPSHLLYYFPGLDAILQSYFAYIVERIIARMSGFRHEDPERKIDLLVELFFGGTSDDKSEIGFMLECFGVAVHDEELKRGKVAIDQFCKSYLQELFEPTAASRAHARNSAEVSYAMLVGLRTAAYFDESLTLRRARAMYREEMLARLQPVLVPAESES